MAEASEEIYSSLHQHFKGDLLRSGQSGYDEARMICEKAGSYPEVAQLTQLITVDTRVVVINQQLIETVRQGIPADRRELLNNSVPLWQPGARSLRYLRSRMNLICMLGNIVTTPSFSE